MTNTEPQSLKFYSINLLFFQIPLSTVQLANVKVPGP